MFKSLTRTQISMCAVLCALIFISSAIAQEHRQSGFRIVWDNFHDGFTIGTPDAKWFYFAFEQNGTIDIADDGRTTTSPHGLNVVSRGTNPMTGNPAFTRTMPQESDNPFGLPGQLDHYKWLVYMNHRSMRGAPGFDAVAGQELSFEAWISGHTFGTDGHPFGSAIADPEDDLRLAATAMSVVDFETLLEFNFFLTNERIYAVYARSPLARDRLGNYAAFTFTIPVAEREPEDWHRLQIAYDRAAGRVRWMINNHEVFSVDRIGRRIDRRFMTLDHGGEEADVTLNQLDGGMGMLTLLDGNLPSRLGLARLSNQPFFYFDPGAGAPRPQTFVDNNSFSGSRLFGQGAELRLRRYIVSSRRSRGEGD